MPTFGGNGIQIMTGPTPAVGAEVRRLSQTTNSCNSRRNAATLSPDCSRNHSPTCGRSANRPAMKSSAPADPH